jgi:hypothetical protein
LKKILGAGSKREQFWVKPYKAGQYISIVGVTFFKVGPGFGFKTCSRLYHLVDSIPPAFGDFIVAGLLVVFVGAGE